MKAILLAAGRGSRMKPLTDQLPKPLLQVGGETLIERQVRKLAEAGFKELVINVAYLKEQIQAHLGSGIKWNVSIQYSVEEEGALETGGGIINALPLLGTNKFAVISSDLWTEYDYRKLFRPLKALGHLVLVENPIFKPKGDFAIENDHLSVDSNPTFTYANIGVYHVDLFTCEQRKFQPLGNILKKAAKSRLLTGELYKGPWFNVGTPKDLETLKSYLQNS